MSDKKDWTQNPNVKVWTWEEWREFQFLKAPIKGIILSKNKNKDLENFIRKS